MYTAFSLVVKFLLFAVTINSDIFKVLSFFVVVRAITDFVGRKMPFLKLHN